jgi:Fic family protein
MDLKNYKSGTYQKQLEYKSFLPSPINQEWKISDPEVIDLLSVADRAIGELNAFSQYVPDIDFFIKMYVTKEATTSSKIEGTMTTFEQAVLSEKEIAPEQRDDWNEVQNYIKAMQYAIKRLAKLPVCNRLLRETHGKLLKGVRGTHKSPGNFRISQNWIGGASLKDAVYIPPHQNDLAECMKDLEAFLNNQDIHVPDLVRVAMAHYQFEAIHPFLDGNGRLGRLLITLYLVSKNILKKPALYLSDFFERNRQLYYDNLRKVECENDFIQWIKFFLVGVAETSDNAKKTFKDILELKMNLESKTLPQMGRRLERAKQLLHHLFTKPVVSVGEVSELLNVTPRAANHLIDEFVCHDILKEQTGYRRNRIFRFEKYTKRFS